jgi:hypothetical protein
VPGTQHKFSGVGFIQERRQWQEGRENELQVMHGAQNQVPSGIANSEYFGRMQRKLHPLQDSGFTQNSE